jgi:hypothetical protein
MSISVGGIDITGTLINLQYQLIRTQAILDFILQNNGHIARPNDLQIKQIDEETFRQLRELFPHAGIEKRPG